MLQHPAASPVTLSGEDASPPSNLSQGSRKRKVGSSTTRGVASLTPDQLAKKRANDREAQRAIRERTKAQIETLERRIHELTSQQPYQELQEVIRQKDAIQAENVEIKRRLTSILHIIQPLVGAQGLTELATAAHGNLTFNNQHDTQPNQFVNGEHGQHDVQPMSHHHTPTTSPHPPFNQQWQGEGQGIEGNKTWQDSVEALNNQRANFQRGLELSEAGERLSFNFLLDGQSNKHTTQQSASSPYPPLTNPAFAEASPPWAALPKNGPPESPLDGILLKFLHSRRQEASNGIPRGPLDGPAYPSVSSLLNPASAGAVDPLSQVMVDIISKFPGICGLSEQVAILINMFWFMRWCVRPTPEHFERIPEWLRPTPSQLFEAHAAWMDYVPWPKIRDKLVVAKPGSYPFENWFIPFTTGISVNWPYHDSDCLLSTNDQEEPLVNPAFERHIMRLDNWSLGPAFAEAYPDLAIVARIQGTRPTTRK